MKLTGFIEAGWPSNNVLMKDRVFVASHEHQGNDNIGGDYTVCAIMISAAQGPVRVMETI